MDLRTCIGFHIMEKEENFSNALREIKKLARTYSLDDDVICQVLLNNNVQPEELENWQINEIRRIVN